jgi:hypothetical protein
MPAATATPKYYLTLQLSIPKDYPTCDWVRGTVAAAVGIRVGMMLELSCISGSPISRLGVREASHNVLDSLLGLRVSAVGVVMVMRDAGASGRRC